MSYEHLGKGAGYQHTWVVTANNSLLLFHCIVCHEEVHHGDEVVLFDKTPDCSRVTAAHGHCISALAKHVMSDRDIARMFAEYRQKLIERGRVDV